MYMYLVFQFLCRYVFKGANVVYACYFNHVCPFFSFFVFCDHSKYAIRLFLSFILTVENSTVEVSSSQIKKNMEVYIFARRKITDVFFFFFFCSRMIAKGLILREIKSSSTLSSNQKDWRVASLPPSPLVSSKISD